MRNCVKSAGSHCYSRDVDRDVSIGKFNKQLIGKGLDK